MAIQTGQNTYTPKSHDSTFHTGATANVLSGITPTKTNWTQAPGTDANIVNELEDAALTTAGIGAAGNNTIVYDLGSSRRRIVQINSEEITFIIYGSDDNITYKAMSGTTNNEDKFALGKFRYLKASINGVVTVSYLKIRCYNLN